MKTLKLLLAQTDLRTASFVTTFEIPFANQREITLGAANLKAFGRDILAGWREYAEKDGERVKVTFAAGGTKSFGKI